MFVRLALTVERRTGPHPLPTSHECTLIGRSGGGAGWRGARGEAEGLTNHLSYNRNMEAITP